MAADTTTNDLLSRYRSDRRNLLHFLFSSLPAGKLLLPPLVSSLEDVAFDDINVDYVIQCCKRGTVVDLSRAYLSSASASGPTVPPTLPPPAAAAAAAAAAVAAAVGSGAATGEKNERKEKLGRVKGREREKENSGGGRVDGKDGSRATCGGNVLEDKGREQDWHLNEAFKPHEEASLRLLSPLDCVPSALSDSDLRHAAYEVLLMSAWHADAAGLRSSSCFSTASSTSFSSSSEGTDTGDGRGGGRVRGRMSEKGAKLKKGFMNLMKKGNRAGEGKENGATGRGSGGEEGAGRDRDGEEMWSSFRQRLKVADELHQQTIAHLLSSMPPPPSPSPSPSSRPSTPSSETASSTPRPPRVSAAESEATLPLPLLSLALLRSALSSSSSPAHHNSTPLSSSTLKKSCLRQLGLLNESLGLLCTLVEPHPSSSTTASSSSSPTAPSSQLKEQLDSMRAAIADPCFHLGPEVAASSSTSASPSSLLHQLQQVETLISSLLSSLPAITISSSSSSSTAVAAPRGKKMDIFDLPCTAVNARIYLLLLACCFGPSDASQPFPDMDMMDAVSSCQSALSISPPLHNLLLAWLLFYEFQRSKALQQAAAITAAFGSGDVDLATPRPSSQGNANVHVSTADMALLLEESEEKLRSLTKFIRNSFNASCSNGGADSAARLPLLVLTSAPSDTGGMVEVAGESLRKFLQPMKQQLLAWLVDYHRHFSPALSEQSLSGALPSSAAALAVVKAVIGVTSACHQLLLLPSTATSAIDPSTESFSNLLVKLVKSSATAASQRVEDAAEFAATEDRKDKIAELAQGMALVVQSECSIFAPALRPFCPNAATVAAEAFHFTLKANAAPYLDWGSTPPPAADDVISAVIEFNVAVSSLWLLGQPEGATSDKAAKQPALVIDVGRATQMMFDSWVDLQRAKISKWLQRAVAAESWNPVGPSHRCASVIDAFRIMEETIDQFLRIRAPLPQPYFLHRLADVLDAELAAYADSIAAYLGSRRDLLLTPPPLTRYKKDMASKVARKAAAASSGSSFWSSSGSSAAGKGDGIEGHRRREIDGMSTESLCVRLNTLQFMEEETASVEQNLQRRWLERRQRDLRRAAAMGLAPDASGSDTASPSDLSFCQTRTSLAASLSAVADFFGTKIVWWNLRTLFADSLYLVSVPSSRIAPIMLELDKEMNEIVDLVSSSLRDTVATAMLQSCVEALLFVLLDGGVQRVFMQTDAPLLKEDLHLLKAFFIAGGHGLPQDDVERSVEIVDEVISLYSCEAAQAIQVFELAHRSRPANKTKIVQPHHWGLPENKTDLKLRVLCHRGDHETSKFLKSHFRLPKS